MTMCPGKRNGRNGTCVGIVFRCDKCGNVGCDKSDCSNQGFAPFKCLKCGALNQRKTLK